MFSNHLNFESMEKKDNHQKLKEIKDKIIVLNESMSQKKIDEATAFKELKKLNSEHRTAIKNAKGDNDPEIKIEEERASLGISALIEESLSIQLKFQKLLSAKSRPRARIK